MSLMGLFMKFEWGQIINRDNEFNGIVHEV